jgi:hypothetical protein
VQFSAKFHSGSYVSFLGRLAVPLGKQTGLPEYPPDADVLIQDYEGQLPITFRRMLQMKIDNGLLLAFLHCSSQKSPGNPGIVLMSSLFGIRLTDAGIAGDLIGTEGREGRNSYRRLTYLGCSSLRTHAPTLTYLPTLNKITNGAVVIVAPHREINMLAGR